MAPLLAPAPPRAGGGGGGRKGGGGGGRNAAFISAGPPKCRGGAAAPPPRRRVRDLAVRDRRGGAIRRAGGRAVPHGGRVVRQRRPLRDPLRQVVAPEAPQRARGDGP